MKKRIAFIAMLLTMASSSVALAQSATISASSLRIRQSPSLSASIIASLSKNAKIDTLGKEGNFYKINYKGKTGYVSSSYVKIDKSTSSSTSTTNVTSTATGKDGIITTQYLNVRLGFGLNYPVTSVIRLGNKVIMYEKINGFYRINYGGKIGYISELYVKATSATTNSTSSATTPVLQSTGAGNVTSSSLNVRKTASMGSNIIGIIKKGLRVNLYGTQDGFYKIMYNGQVGYISKTYISLSNSAVITSQNTETKSISSFMSYLNTFLGMPYLWGGTTPAIFNAAGKYECGGFDCSGLIQYAYKSIGVNLPRITMDQVNVGTTININNLQQGDLVFFRTNTAAPNQVSHAGIYVGNNKFMQSPKTGSVVKITELTGYFRDHFVTGKRVIK